MKTPAAVKLVCLANCLISLLAVYLLLSVYGQLHWFLRDILRTSPVEEIPRLRFINAMDKIHLVAAFMAGLVLVANIALISSRAQPVPWVKFSLAVSILSFLTVCFVAI